MNYGKLTTDRLGETSDKVRVQLATAVAQFAELLRRDPWTQSEHLQGVAAIAYVVQRELPFDADVAEFAHLVDQAQYLRD